MLVVVLVAGCLLPVVWYGYLSHSSFSLKWWAGIVPKWSWICVYVFTGKIIPSKHSARAKYDSSSSAANIIHKSRRSSSVNWVACSTCCTKIEGTELGGVELQLYNRKFPISYLPPLLKTSLSAKFFWWKLVFIHVGKVELITIKTFRTWTRFLGEVHMNSEMVYYTPYGVGSKYVWR